MSLHTKILATLWIWAVLLVGLHRYGAIVSSGKKPDTYLIPLSWADEIESFTWRPGVFFAALAIGDAVLYGMMWVWS